MGDEDDDDDDPRAGIPLRDEMRSVKDAEELRRAKELEEQERRNRER